MEKLLFALVLVLPVSLHAQTATIKIDVDRTIGEIDPNIYGVFMEPIHFSRGDSIEFNTLYGTLYDPSSPLADENGFKKNYIEAMKELQITNMRWPGGNFVMGYNWQDGIGPKNERPTRINLAWGGYETNHVGTDEWIALNESIGSENVICLNLGLGNIENARAWLEYTNYKGGTYYSDLRAEYGHPEPYNIKFWNLGNEVDGEPWELGHKTADDYVKIAKEAAKALKATDPDITLVASGSSYYEETGKWIEWNRKIITELTGVTDYLSIHRYWEGSEDYYEFMGDGALDVEEKITTTQAQIEIVKSLYPDKKPMVLAVDEWGSFGQSIRSTLATAEYFNSFIRHADIVKMSNFTLMTSLLSIGENGETYKSPLFYTFKLFSNNSHGLSVDTFVEGDTFDTEKNKDIPYLNATTAYSEETNSIVINVVNRHKEKAVSADIVNNSAEFTGKAEVRVVAHPLDVPFAIDKSEQYKPEKEEINTREHTIQYSFPPHSFTQILVKVKN